jgi:hypothetical protein
MLPLLICEGACNPYIGAVDALVREYAGRFGVPSDLLVVLRSLRYTSHIHVRLEGEHDIYQCTVCGHERLYGAWELAA